MTPGVWNPPQMKTTKRESGEPDFFPGPNPQINVYAAEFGIPLEAVRGGAETMYPEYRGKMATMPKATKKK